jgi:hypothetical protein
MRKIILLFLPFYVFILTNQSRAQGGTAVPFLLIHPAPKLNAMAGCYTALASDDPFGFFYNPAQMGVYSQSENFSFQYAKSKWLPQFNFSDLSFKTFGFTLGYNFKNISKLRPFSLGVGYMKSTLSWGQNIWYDEYGRELATFESQEWYNALCIGICYNNFVKISLGYTYKSIVSDLSPIMVRVGTETPYGGASANAHDIGMHFTLPVSNFYSHLFDNLSTQKYQLHPITDFSLGFSLHNVGDEIYYLDKHQADPLPRQAKIGYAVSIGVSMELNEIETIPLMISWSSEANDMLIKRDESGKSKYQSYPGDIKVLKHIIDLGGDENVINRFGISTNVFETVHFSFGKYNLSGITNIYTRGYGLSLRGIFKLIVATTNSRTAKDILLHSDIQFNMSCYNPDESDHPIDDTKFYGLTLSIYNY